MEYVFGRDKTETLRTKGRERTSLTGFQEVVQEYPDCIITDSFRVVKHIKSDKDSEGNFYDWYEIDSHNRMIDRTGPISADMISVGQSQTDLQLEQIEQGQFATELQLQMMEAMKNV